MIPAIDSAFRRIPVTDIEVTDGGRALQPDRVTDLAASIQLIGMLSPIGVRMVNTRPRLVYGRHRLAAARSLGWTEIECRVLEADDRRARMAEIAENLHRAELTLLERSEQIAEWVGLAVETVDDKPGQVAQVSPARGNRGNRGGLSQAADEIGVSRKAAHRAQTVAALPGEAKIAAKDLGLDNNQSALVKAAKSPNPVASLRQHVMRPRRSPGKITQEENPSKKTALQELFNAWNRADPKERLDFIRTSWEAQFGGGAWKDWVIETVKATVEGVTSSSDGESAEGFDRISVILPTAMPAAIVDEGCEAETRTTSAFDAGGLSDAA
jgi:ParB family transcriptional regulator, chromosome partitioning protein